MTVHNQLINLHENTKPGEVITEMCKQRGASSACESIRAFF